MQHQPIFAMMAGLAGSPAVDGEIMRFAADPEQDPLAFACSGTARQAAE